MPRKKDVENTWEKTKSNSGSDTTRNLQALHWEENLKKSDKYK